MSELFDNEELILVILLGPLLLAGALTQYLTNLFSFFIYAAVFIVCLILVFFKENNRFYIIISLAPLVKIVELSLEAPFLNYNYALIILYLAWLGMLFLAKESLATNISRKTIIFWPIAIGIGLILGVVEYLWLGSNLWLGQSIYFVIVIAILAAVVEELYFRRALFGKFKAEHAALPVSLLYIAMLPNWNIANVIILLGANLILCDLYKHTQSILMTILAHASMNVTVLLLMPSFFV